ncbi:recombination protein NinG [Paraburkholderia antibiotica]|uniref:Recombinase NinG n=1 Tax=Paraburkholderia antibiotica TaxID=2728839 RepID=A0A7Y0FGE1_9BURK|nr:recombination protein NinG [Paraburkholderia antibiotica]NML34925.1 recombinase NinG [Paraburkholderia antibiotica]
MESQVIRTSIKPKALKPRKCRMCSNVFIPFRSTTTVCSPKCAEAWSNKLKAQKAARAKREERKSLAERKAKLKTRREWIAECQAIVNKVARLRDQLADRGCISCGSYPTERFGGGMDAGHFRSVGSAAHMRFFLPNISAQCKKCNRDLGGSHTNYRKGLIERIGINRVEEIESMQWTAKWDIDYLKRLKKVMNKKARRLERRIEQRKELEAA